MEKIPGTDYNKGIVIYGTDIKVLRRKAKELANYHTDQQNVYFLNGWNTERFKSDFLFQGTEKQEYMIVNDLRTLQDISFFASKITHPFLINQIGKFSFNYMFKQIIITIDSASFSPAELLELDPSTKRRFTFIECK